MKIGLLYPSSNAYPSIGIEFIDGLKKCLQLKDLSEKITLIAEGIGFGAIEKEVFQKAEKLLIVEDVDALVAYIDLKTSNIIEPLLIASEKLMIVVNTGANCPQNWTAKPNIIFLTLQHSFLCWLNGLKATQTNNKNGLLATSFYDCGFTHSAAMVDGFLSNDGNITYNYINNQPYDNNFHINELINFLSSDKSSTQNLLCVFDLKPAELFYNRLKASGTSADLQLFASPMMLENGALKDLAETFPFSIAGFIPWHSLLENENNTAFNSYCNQRKKTVTNTFLLQGWETALLLAELFLNKTDNNNISDLVQTIFKEPIKSPRGNLILDIKTNYFLAPIVHALINANTAKPIITITDEIQNWEVFTTSVKGNDGGWFNTYLCY